MPRNSLAPLLALAALSCSSSNAGAPGKSDARDAGPSASSPTAVTVSIGPIDLPTGSEKTVCITRRLGNPDPLVVSAIEATLAPGSHHLIVYRVADPQENLTPTPCMPFTGLISNKVAPLALVNKDHFTSSLPSGVGVEIDANQMLRIEAHYINATAGDIQGQGSVTFHGAAKASAPAWLPANFAFWGTTSITVPAGSTATVGPNFQVGIPGTHLISVSTHQHSLGTGIQVWASAHEGDLSNMIANDADWSNPAWRPLDPHFDFDGTSGLSYQCSWKNTTSHDVSFGESALDEMCFVGGYYYPSQGFDLCLNGSCKTRVADGGVSAAAAPSPEGGP